MSSKLEEKKIIVEEIKNKLQNSQSAIIIDYKGLNVEQATKLRKECRENDVDYKIYKNTLIKIAANEIGLEDKEGVFEGPTAIAFGMKDPVAPAKILKKYIGEFKKCEFKAGIVDGEFYTADEVVKLADLPSKEELIAKMLGSLNAPISGLVRSLSGIIGGLGIVLNAIKEQKANEA
ncbi:MAG: 50S ribosomal protein L10 [Clostridiales bacterium]|nr:50S ribosomal protein L10 [Clostridiales bacterium]